MSKRNYIAVKIRERLNSVACKTVTELYGLDKNGKQKGNLEKRNRLVVGMRMNTERVCLRMAAERLVVTLMRMMMCRRYGGADDEEDEFWKEASEKKWFDCVANLFDISTPPGLCWLICWMYIGIIGYAFFAYAINSSCRPGHYPLSNGGLQRFATILPLKVGAKKCAVSSFPPIQLDLLCPNKRQ